MGVEVRVRGVGGEVWVQGQGARVGCEGEGEGEGKVQGVGGEVWKVGCGVRGRRPGGWRSQVLVRARQRLPPQLGGAAQAAAHCEVFPMAVAA